MKSIASVTCTLLLSLLIGSSPEILVRLEDKTIEVRPIAGTRKRGATKDEDLALEKELLADPKERAEHLMLVDLGRNALPPRYLDLAGIKTRLLPHTLEFFFFNYYFYPLDLDTTIIIIDRCTGDTNLIEPVFWDTQFLCVCVCERECVRGCVCVCESERECVCE